MRTWTHCLILLIAAALLAGCQQDSEENGDNYTYGNARERDSDKTASKPTGTTDRSNTTGKSMDDSGESLMMVRGNPHRKMVTYLPAGKDNAAVRLTKTAPQQVMVGETFEYKLKVENRSTDTLRDAVLTANLPANMDVRSTRPKAKLAGETATWSIDKMAAGASKTFTVSGSATKTGQMEACSDMRFTVPTACVPIEAVEPALRVMLEGPDEVLICEPLAYTATVTNTGSGPAKNVSFSSKLPDGLTVSRKRTISRDLGTLEPGKAKRIVFEADASKTGSMDVQASAKGGNGASGSDSVKTTVRQPVLSVSVDAPKTRYVDGPMTARITVTNDGDGEARQTALTATVPDNVRFLSASDKGSRSGDRVSWDLGTLKPDASRTVTVKMKAIGKGDAKLFASSAATCSKASARATTAVKGIPAILLECVDTTDPVPIGQNETYEIKVTNQGSAVGTGIVITCTLPEEMDFVSATGPTKHSVKGRKVTFEPIKSLAPKKQAKFKVVTKGTKPGDLRFEVTLKSDQMTKPAGETESTHVYSDEAE
jgi:uncharacterized repeat protein (TIGR01451 family)